MVFEIEKGNRSQLPKGNLTCEYHETPKRRRKETSESKGTVLSVYANSQPNHFQSNVGVIGISVASRRQNCHRDLAAAKSVGGVGGAGNRGAGAGPV
jgi:hypothetical protein